MKQRILERLYEFSKTKVDERGSTLFNLLKNDLKLDKEELQKRAEITLKQILHNYAFFDISTIDKFTHRIIRTFAKDLKLPQNFEVVLDTDILLDEAVNRLINKTGADNKLTEILLEFALEKIDDDKSWDIAFDLNKIGKLLFNENHYSPLKAISGNNIDDFIRLKKALIRAQKSLQEKAKKTALEVLEYIQECGLEYTDFPRETLPNHFKKIKDGIFNPLLLYNNKLEENIEGGNFLKSGFELPAPEIASFLLEKYKELKADIYTIAFYKNAYDNSVPLTIINAIQQELRDLEKERDLLPISSFNRIISNEIKDQPAPFIYERLGEKYRHYFIDEFQDTSEMQWNNLIPLISNALDSEDEQGKRGSLFLVGDAKQAIYRWRGGRAEQFLNLLSSEQQAFVIDPKVHDLPINFRSGPEIVAFNNSFFSSIAAYLNKAAYNSLYTKGSNQQSNAEAGGYIELSFLNNDAEEDIEQLYLEKILGIIEKSLEHGFDYNDIAILTRKRKEGILISDFLMQNDIPLVSSETLLLKRNKKVAFLIALLKHCIQPLDLENNYNILYFLEDNPSKKHSSISENLSEVTQLLKEGYDFDINFLKQNAVYDGLEYAIKKFALVNTSDAYITFLLDEVLGVEMTEDAGVSSFLNFWEKKENSLSIVAPANLNAVRIMTIHKAKGLEFPVVIFPFANTFIYEEMNPKLWLPLPSHLDPAFEQLLISKKNEVQHYSPEATRIFEDEHFKLELDAFNLLYVALTRAVDALYILTEKDLTKTGEHKPRYFSGLFIHYLKEQGLWISDLDEYSFGTLDFSKQSASSNIMEKTIPYLYTYKNRPEFRVIAKSDMLWDSKRQEALSKGTAIHRLMETIYHREDMESALNRFKSAVNFDGAIEKYRVLANTIINHPRLKGFYDNDMHIKNECDILTENGLILRPDRLVFNGNKVAILDYKTGKKQFKHKEQLYAYSDALERMGFEVNSKVIVYIDKQVTAEFI